MNVRLLFALLVIALLTAFAPAPFPRSGRRGDTDTISLKSLQGVWRVTRSEQSQKDGSYQPYRTTLTHIRIEEDQWCFSSHEKLVNRFSLAVDGTKKPAWLTFYPKGKARHTTEGVGIIRRTGRAFQILYTWGGEPVRATSFEAPPNQQWLLTLER